MDDRASSRIRLRVSGGDGVGYRSWPVTQGIPFADGALERGTPVRVVDERGRALPTQTMCLAAWDKDLTYVRWLLVDFQVDLDPGQERELFLEYGEGARPPEPDQPVHVEQRGDFIRMDTGSMRLDVRNTFVPWKPFYCPDVFARCLIEGQDGGQDVFRGNPGPFLYMRDSYGNRYDSCTAGPIPQVVVEEAGPMRACVCIKGYHAMRQGPRFCPYILRIHLFAGKSDLRMYHTFVFDQEPHQIELASVGMAFPLDLGDALRAAVGGAHQAHWAGHWDALRFLQADDRHYTVMLDGICIGSGEKTAGWASLNGRRGAVVAVIKDHWKEYPKGFCLNEDGIDVQIWPDTCGEPLTFTTPFEEPAVYFGGTRDEEEVKRLLSEHPTAPLNLKSFDVQTEADLLWVEEVLEQYAPERTASHNDTGTSNGTGAAKTTELYLRLSAQAVDDTEAEMLAQAVQEPLIAPADPSYTCATGAVGPFYHADDPRFEDVDKGLDDLLQTVAIEPMERCRLYGMMRYGNMVCSHAAGPTLSYLHYKDSEPEKALRYVGPYNNEANDQIMGVWGNFLRTGRREHLFLAQGYSRNVADVGIIHAHPTHPNAVGLMHYHNGHQWSGGPSPSHTLISGILMDYYFTGNRRLLEVALEVADWAVRTQEPCGIISCRNGVLHREFTGPLWCVIEAYRATWMEEYGDLAERSLYWFLRTLPRPGYYPVSVYTRGDRGDEAFVEPECTPLAGARDVYHLFSAALRLFDSQRLREHILAEADYYVWEGLTDNFVTAEMARTMLTSRSLLWQVDDDFYWTQWGLSGHYNAAVVCLAYDLTGDMTYAAYCKDHLEGVFRRQAKRCRHFADWRFTWLCFGSYIPRLMRTVAEALDRDPEMLCRAEEAWRRKRAELGRPVYTGPGVDLAKDQMDANGHILNRPPVDLPREAPPRPIVPPKSIGRLSTVRAFRA